MVISLRTLRNDQHGYEQINSLAKQTENISFDRVIFDMRQVDWINADMCSPLGAVLHRLQANQNDIAWENFNPAVQSILSKNGFLRAFGRSISADIYRTTIEYRKFSVREEGTFNQYVEQGLKNKGLPTMSAAVWTKFCESLIEIFTNAIIHSETQHGIFTCGQQFPNKNLLTFTITDLGIGIRSKIEQVLGLRFTGSQAIDWATQDKNTTRTGDIPGGLGLKLLKEFISLNQGRLQIVSDSGFWELAKGQTRIHNYTSCFPGTVVSIEINTADTCSYHFASELNLTEIL